MKVIARTLVLAALGLPLSLAAGVALAEEPAGSVLFRPLEAGASAPLCLSNRAGEFASVAKGGDENLSALRLVVTTSIDADGETIHQADMKLAFKDSSRQYTLQTLCGKGDADGKSLSCYIPCGGGVSLDLEAVSGDLVKAKLIIDAEVFTDSMATGGLSETIEMMPVDMKNCQPDATM